MGYDARLWVVDAKDAFYRVPIKQRYWRYMGIKWFGLIFIFTSLQMGLGSACAIYQRFADAILFIIRNNSGKLFIGIGGEYYIYHYLDDFFGGHADSETAWQQLRSVVVWFADLGIPTQWKKLKFPFWRQIILGWLWNTRAGTVSLPQSKVTAYSTHLLKLIRERQRGATKKILEQVNGQLEHSAVVVYPGKAKNRNIQHAMHLELYNYSERIYLSDLVIDDLKWWLHALQHMNGIPLEWIISNPDIYQEEIWTDAALRGEDIKLGGIGGCSSLGSAFQLDNRSTFVRLVAAQRHGIDIKLMEFIALYVMVVVRAPFWQYKNIRFWCDNDTVVWTVSKKRAPLIRRDLNYLLNKICELSATYHFRFWIEYIEGKENVVADSLSRFKEIYASKNVDVKNFDYVDSCRISTIVNQVFLDLLNFKLVPRNDDDPAYIR